MSKELNNKVNVEWEGNLYVEITPFTFSAYNELLVTDPSAPNLFGSFLELQTKYFDYLEAKGRGEDVKSPITIFDTKEFFYHKRSDIDDFLTLSDNFVYNRDSNYKMSFIPDIKLKSDKTEGHLTYNSPPKIKDEIRKALYDKKTSGSFEFDKEINIPELNKNLYDYYRFPIDYKVNLEWSNRADRLFAEILNDKDECVVTFTYDKKSSFLSCDINSDLDFKKEAAGQLNAYIKDIDFNDIRKAERYTQNHGNYLESKMKEATNPDPMTWNFNNVSEVSLNAWLQLKRYDINKTTYYKYCNPDKISFREFQALEKIPLGILNNRTINEFKMMINKLDVIYDIDKNGFRIHLDIDKCDHFKKTIGSKNLNNVFNKLVDSEKTSISVNVDMSDNIKHYLDQDFEVFNLKDYGDEIGGSFIYRNLEFEFDYNPSTEEINLMYFDYFIEDNETGYYKQLELPELMKNPAIQDMLVDQIDLQVNNFIAENRYGSLDDMLAAAEAKSKETISKETKVKDELEL